MIRDEAACYVKTLPTLGKVTMKFPSTCNQNDRAQCSLLREGICKCCVFELGDVCLSSTPCPHAGFATPTDSFSTNEPCCAQPLLNRHVLERIKPDISGQSLTGRTPASCGLRHKSRFCNRLYHFVRWPLTNACSAYEKMAMVATPSGRCCINSWTKPSNVAL